MTRCALGLGLACSLACSGCSYAFMRPAPADHEQLEWVDCTSSRLAPVADSVGVVEGVGTALAVQVFATMGLGEGDDEVSTEARVIQVLALGVAGVYLASAIHGFSGAEECERAKALSNLRQLEHANAEAAAVAPAPAILHPGCQGDAECKGGRRCVAGSCTWPTPTPTPPAPAPLPATDASPAVAPIPAASPPAPAP